MLEMKKEMTTDPRHHWDKFKRRELWAIANLEGIRFTPGAPANDIRMMLLNNGVDTRKYMPQRLGPLYGDTGKQVHHVKKEFLKQRHEDYYEDVPNVKVEIENVNPENLKFNEKKRFMREHGIKYNRRDTNEILRQKIEVYMNGKNLT